MRRTLLTLAVVPALLMTALPAQAATRTFVTYDCQHVRIEPARILFACGDGAFYANHLTWSRWRRLRAVGHGEFHQNDCTPSCAQGTFHRQSGKIVLRGRKWCGNINKYVFARARIRYDHPLLGQDGSHTRLSCPV